MIPQCDALNPDCTNRLTGKKEEEGKDCYW